MKVLQNLHHLSVSEDHNELHNGAKNDLMPTDLHMHIDVH